MKVICKQNKMPDDYELLVLFKPEGQKDTHDDNYYAVEYGYYNDFGDKKFDINLNVEYEVYGIMFYKGKTRYLVICEGISVPQWILDDMFEIVDYRFPYNWYCNTFISDNLQGTVIGYKELTDYQHLLGLMFNYEKDVKKFLDIKEKIEYFT
ncbi:MAG: hypothetical protein PHR25_01250 [Clostridia bacterium]|nr:hypothetical protein [Clostridia bacterium]MDD4375393.1 hypothetical protein [Clostridia bacterium]